MTTSITRLPIAALLAFGFAFALPATAGAETLQGTEPMPMVMSNFQSTVTFTGEGHIMMQPDQGSVIVVIKSEGADARVVANENTARVKVVEEELKGLFKAYTGTSLVGSKTETYYRYQWPRYDATGRKPTGVVITYAMRVTTPVDLMGQVVAKATELNVQPGNPVFVVHDKLAKMADARKLAFADAYAQATAFAAEASLITGKHYIIGGIIYANYVAEPRGFYSSSTRAVAPKSVVHVEAVEFNPEEQDISAAGTFTFSLVEGK